MAKTKQSSVKPGAYFNKPAKTAPATRLPTKANFWLSFLKAARAAGHTLIDPLSIALVGFILGGLTTFTAQTQLEFSLIDALFWGVGTAVTGLVFAYLRYSSVRFKLLGTSLNDTRRQIAITARILSEALDETEKFSKPASGSAQGYTENSPVASSVQNQGLTNIARAQVILANKSDADIGVLSGLIRDLADIVSDQERELALARSESREARQMAQDAAKVARQILQLRHTSLDAPPSPLTERVVLGTAHSYNPADNLLVSKLEKAFEDDGFIVSLQPVVTLPQRKVKLYELGLMLKGDAPGRSGVIIRKAILAAGLATSYDRMLVNRSLHMIAHFRSRQKDITIVCELTGALLIADTEFDKIIQELRMQPTFAQSLVLGLSAETYASLSVSEKDAMAFLGETGVKFAVMGLTNMKLDPQSLGNAGVRFVTIDVTRLMEAVPTGLQGLDVHVADLAGLFARRKIELIVQNIASDRDLLDIIEMDIPLAQGKLLGEPRSLSEIKPVEETAPAPVAKESVGVGQFPTALPMGAMRQPLKNFLRRA